MTLRNKERPLPRSGLYLVIRIGLEPTAFWLSREN